MIYIEIKWAKFRADIIALEKNFPTKKYIKKCILEALIPIYGFLNSGGTIMYTSLTTFLQISKRCKIQCKTNFKITYYSKVCKLF